MNYGLYLSASGVIANSYRQDVIANNLANGETVGFKRDLTPFQQRLTEAQQNRNLAGHTNPMLDNIGGGLLVSPTRSDMGQGDFEQTGRSLDTAIQGDGFFMVEEQGKLMLSRDGRFNVDADGYLITAGVTPRRVLDKDQAPIRLNGEAHVRVHTDGTITQQGSFMARLGVVEAPDRRNLLKAGDGAFHAPPAAQLRASESNVQSGFVERSNVSPTLELTQLMETQRMLEANANMIRYQDQMLGKLVNEVGKIG